LAYVCQAVPFLCEKPPIQIFAMTTPNLSPERPPSLWQDEDGTTAVEYAVMLALIVAVCIGSVATLTAETKKSFDDSGAAIAGAFGN
jgi:pilus assembly protein Flp/PilA